MLGLFLFNRAPLLLNSSGLNIFPPKPPKPFPPIGCTPLSYSCGVAIHSRCTPHRYPTNPPPGFGYFLELYLAFYAPPLGDGDVPPFKSNVKIKTMAPAGFKRRPPLLCNIVMAFQIPGSILPVILQI